MSLLAAYLTFNGQCAEAFRFYEQALGGKIDALMTFAGSPMENDVPAQYRDQVMHASMTIQGQTLMGSDGMPGQCEGGMSGFALSLHFNDVAEARATFERLAAGGTVTMPLQATFWAAAFGTLNDRFGVPWMINCEAPAA